MGEISYVHDQRARALLGGVDITPSVQNFRERAWLMAVAVLQNVPEAHKEASAELLVSLVRTAGHLGRAAPEEVLRLEDEIRTRSLESFSR